MNNDILRRIWQYRFFYAISLPALLYFLVFHYVPMAGLIIAFKNIDPFLGLAGIWEAPWVGFLHFQRFFSSIYFWNVIGNTVYISGLKILFGFPAPILLALLLNEVYRSRLRSIFQTISYLPHFISWVVTAGMITALLATSGGLLTEALNLVTGQEWSLLGSRDHFVSILVTSHVWKTIGWQSIIYLAAMVAIDPALYEAAKMDGASRWQQAIHVTIPGIGMVIVIMFIFEVGNLLDAGFEQILLLYSPAVYAVSDIVDTFVYREGLLGLNYSFATAVGLFKSVIALVLIMAANHLAKRLGQQGIW